jgi:hypothetical protein
MLVVTWMRTTREPSLGGPKKKGAKKKSAKQISSQQDEEEEGYTQRKSHALSMWYLPVIDRLWAIFGNPEDAQLMSRHASGVITQRTMASCVTLLMASSGSVSISRSQSLAKRRRTLGSR